MSNTLVVDTTLQATQQASDFSVLGFKSILTTSTNTPEELTIDTFRDGVRPLLLSNPLVDILAPGNAEKFLTNGTLTTDRATIGTRVNKTTKLVETLAIDTIREEAEGFLIEGASTNLCIKSENLDDVAFVKLNGIVNSDAHTAPDGAATMDELEVTSVSAVQGISSPTFTSDGTSTFTQSFFILKSLTNFDVTLYFRSSIGAGNQFSILTFNPSTSVVDVFVLGSSTDGGFKITDLGLFIRVDISAKGIPAGPMRGHIRLISQPIGNKVAAWGWQIEALPFASSYIKTTTTAVTRAADDVSIDAANWSNNDEYSILLGGSVLGELSSGGIHTFIYVDKVSAADRTQIHSKFGATKHLQSVGSVDQFFITYTPVDPTDITNFATTFKLNDANAYESGVLKGNDNSALALPSGIDNINIGRRDNADRMYGHLKDLMIFERALNQLEIVTLNSGSELPATNSSVEDPLFPFINTLDFRDNTKYSPLVTSGTVVIEFNQSVVQPIDYFAFAIHNSQDAGLTGKLEVDSGAGFEIVAEFASVKNNRPFLKFFGTKNTQRQKLTLNFNSKLFIGTIFLGEAVVFNRTPSLGFRPGRTAPLDTVEQFTTDGNNFIIGRRINRGFNEKSTFRFVKFDDLDLFYEDFQNHVLDSKSVFFKWSDTKNQTIFGLQNARTMTKPTYETSFHSSISFDISGYS